MRDIFLVMFYVFFTVNVAYILYLELSMATYMKEGKKRYFWVPGWFLNPSLFTEVGLKYRRKYIKAYIVLFGIGIPWLYLLSVY